MNKLARKLKGEDNSQSNNNEEKAQKNVDYTIRSEKEEEKIA